MPTNFHYRVITSTSLLVEQHGPVKEISSNLSNSSTPTN
jgi:hypothetical protein